LNLLTTLFGLRCYKQFCLPREIHLFQQISPSCEVIKIEQVLAENITEILDTRFSGEEKIIFGPNFKFHLLKFEHVLAENITEILDTRFSGEDYIWTEF